MVRCVQICSVCVGLARKTGRMKSAVHPSLVSERELVCCILLHFYSLVSERPSVKDDQSV